jgi:hypothetical protein
MNDPKPFTDMLFDVGSPYKLALAVMVGLSYLLWTIALALIVYRSYRQKSYGMPGLAAVSMLSTCFIAGFFGPWASPRHFYSKENIVLVLIWVVWTALMLVIYAQYIKHGGVEASLSDFARGHFRLVAVSSFAVALLTQWTFILFFDDYYVNVVCPFLCVLPMAYGYVKSIVLEYDMRGQSPAAAWLLTIGTALLYLAVVLGEMSEPYPNKDHYTFIYWISILTVAMLYVYSIALTRERLRDRLPLHLVETEAA